MDVQGHLVGGFLFLAQRLEVQGLLLAFGVFFQACYVAFGCIDLAAAALHERFPLLENASLEFDGVLDFLHEVAVVVQQGRVHAGAAAQDPTVLGFFGVGLELLHLLLGQDPLALYLGQRGQCLIAPFFGDVDDFLQCLDVAHAGLSS